MAPTTKRDPVRTGEEAPWPLPGEKVRWIRIETHPQSWIGIVVEKSQRREAQEKEEEEGPEEGERTQTSSPSQGQEERRIDLGFNQMRGRRRCHESPDPH